MKNTRNPRFFGVWIALLSYLVLGFGGLSGMVLCFEPDGRVALEAGINGVCSDSWEERQPPQATPGKASFHSLPCKRCVDLPLSMSGNDPEAFLMPHSFQELTQIPMTFVSALSQDWMGFFATVTQNVLPHPPPLCVTLQAFLRTIILLI